MFAKRETLENVDSPRGHWAMAPVQRPPGWGIVLQWRGPGDSGDRTYVENRRGFSVSFRICSQLRRTRQLRHIKESAHESIKARLHSSCQNCSWSVWDSPLVMWKELILLRKPCRLSDAMKDWASVLDSLGSLTLKTFTPVGLVHASMSFGYRSVHYCKRPQAGWL